MGFIVNIMSTIADVGKRVSKMVSKSSTNEESTSDAGISTNDFANSGIILQPPEMPAVPSEPVTNGSSKTTAGINAVTPQPDHQMQSNTSSRSSVQVQENVPSLQPEKVDESTIPQSSYQPVENIQAVPMVGVTEQNVNQEIVMTEKPHFYQPEESVNEPTPATSIIGRQTFDQNPSQMTASPFAEQNPVQSIEQPSMSTQFLQSTTTPSGFIPDQNSQSQFFSQPANPLPSNDMINNQATFFDSVPEDGGSQSAMTGSTTTTTTSPLNPFGIDDISSGSANK